MHITKLINGKIYIQWKHTHGEEIYMAKYTFKSNILMVETYIVKCKQG